jgi:hypothetical protein
MIEEGLPGLQNNAHGGDTTDSGPFPEPRPLPHAFLKGHHSFLQDSSSSIVNIYDFW